jgi:hypothetical protein
VVLALISFSKGREGAEAWVDPMRILVTVSRKLVSYLTDDVVGKPGMLNMVVEALAAILFADKVGDEAKEVVVIAVVVGDLGRMVTMLLAKGANDAAVLDVILTSPVVDVDANTTITDRSELFLDLFGSSGMWHCWCIAMMVKIHGQLLVEVTCRHHGQHHGGHVAPRVTEILNHFLNPQLVPNARTNKVTVVGNQNFK